MPASITPTGAPPVVGEATPDHLMRRREAVEFLRSRGHQAASIPILAKLACIGGGPEIVYVGNGPRPIPYYAPKPLLAWAESLVSAPVHRARDARSARTARSAS